MCKCILITIAKFDCSFSYCSSCNIILINYYFFFHQKCSRKIHSFCDLCNMAYVGGTADDHPNHHGNTLEFPGIFIQRDFISPEEESDILEHIYKSPFVESQSGRRKQVIPWE